MFLHCIAYHNGIKLADVELTGIASYLEQPGCFIWVALRNATGEELAQMQSVFNLHELAVEDANHGHQRPKIEEYDNELFAVMHLVEERETPEKTTPGKTDPDKTGGKDKEGKEHRLHVGEMHVFAGPRYIVSIQNDFRQDLFGVRVHCEREPKNLARGPGYVFYTLMDTVVDSYFPLIEKLETAIEHIEERIFAHGGALNASNGIRRLYRLKRRATVLKHAVTPLMEAAGRLHSGRVPEVCEKSRHYFRDIYDHLLRLNAALDSMRDATTTAIQVNLALVASDQAEINKRLAAWAGIFAIVTALAGVWGMNFEHMPELKWEYGYPAAIGLIVAAAGVLYWRFRRARWL
ncbi:MAG: magnesium and cobalt transport protein CorA [Azoarcus sp.]|jgi:magnesium transporter|nr:magnesium and cobalt transport protein CorA [Azoarcus sp.]